MKIVNYLILGLLLNVSKALFAQSPDVIWVQQNGETISCQGMGIATDTNNNLAITGVIGNKREGKETVYLSEYDQNGNLLWKGSKSQGEAVGTGVTYDHSGNILVTGYFFHSIKFGQDSLNSQGPSAIFICKYTNSGEIIWVKQLDASDWCGAWDITSDNSNDIYITGYFHGTLNNAIISHGDADIFIAKYDQNGNMLWIRTAGGDSYDSSSRIDIDKDGNLYVCGDFSSIANFENATIQSKGSFDVFIAKYSQEGEFKWVNSAGGNGSDRGKSLSVDSDGNIFITGSFANTAFFDDFQITSKGLEGTANAFIAKYNNKGMASWAKSAGGSDSAVGYGIATDFYGNCIVTGYFNGRAYFDELELVAPYGHGAFFSKYRSDGKIIWVQKAIGSKYNDQADGDDIVVDHSDNPVIVGTIKGTINFNETLLSSKSDYDIFVTKLEYVTTTVKSKSNKHSKNILVNYPNPFNSTTSIQFSLDIDQIITLRIFNIKGEMITTLLDKEYLSKGEHKYIWDGKDKNNLNVSSGIYFIKINTEEYAQTCRVLLIR